MSEFSEKTKYKRTLFIFRRDLRKIDNSGLIAASKTSLEVIPAFIIDPLLIKKSNRKFSEFRMQFLKDCICELNEQLLDSKSHLHIFSGHPKKIILDLITDCKIDAIFVNRDYTPFSKKRDKEIKRICEENKIDFVIADDILLHDVDTIKTGKGEPYKIFTAFFSKAKELPIRQPQKYNFSNLSDAKIKSETTIENISELKIKRNSLQQKGGRESCLERLENIKNLVDYDEKRNFPAINGTSLLSAHNKFGTCSIREIYEVCINTLGPNHTIIRELYWRDFFTYLMHHFQYTFSKEFNKNFQKIKWHKDKKYFLKWCKGQTGFPIVDAGMRELNQTGFMHNRVRMIVASFLTKDMHIDWRLGEKYFATKLIDYDPCVNIGNWQWAASTGCDAQPWFRIFNPWIQQKKFDPNCTYIKKWIPELKELPAKNIHLLWKSFPKNSSYPKPILEHKSESQKSKEIFKMCTV
ncbi:cryptochrome/photolyase family protein [Nitrosopumilus piranensis]|uniref:Deoxyribodipyrimidine photo-lyase n=1 Tax=Nitrosopumilus piranensis TaxID=1582439 RepID=A0A0C5BZH8_9ARCH|nr:deoxyribodipyrimidine photo-lyase [Nitrosopumilus piranensis]AJM92400.1 deoxyribodipyrimidine photo-lyase [Nitrosopumilus piranensis]